MTATVAGLFQLASVFILRAAAAAAMNEHRPRIAVVDLRGAIVRMSADDWAAASSGAEGLRRTIPVPVVYLVDPEVFAAVDGLVDDLTGYGLVRHAVNSPEQVSDWLTLWPQEWSAGSYWVPSSRSGSSSQSGGSLLPGRRVKARPAFSPPLREASFGQPAQEG